MSSALPKGKMSAWQRWEMDSFSEPQIARPVKLTPEQNAAAEQLRQAMEQAREIGRKEGQAEGLELGRQAGYDDGTRQAQQERAQLQELLQGLSTEMARAHQSVSDAVLTLSLDIAKAMLKTALTVNRALVLPVVEQAVREIAMVQQPAHIALHPDDAELVRRHMQDALAEAGWQVRDDPSLQPGDCVLDTASNHIDATAGTRWQRIAAALGAQGDWLP